ncbi:efflux RND transporter periplasmic adaptor subunit [Rhizobium deserti]|uniref:Efflux RND transporter periplasmic adaptor subunit n=1 Tax=Rhizobium deserti TaxID=2547961 RepID=A0A4V3APS3_9HYPH|nr:efflux RND transporter periplasmic adaptor subunit [Rhizobium deserti]TDK38840.1 efflux RND transporter periplasmic adaptor subunit [Rhizobium deserti]
MRIWKQLLLCVVALFGALCLWVFMVPSAGVTLIGMGVPAKAVELVSGAPAKTAGEAGTGPARGGSEGQQAGAVDGRSGQGERRNQNGASGSGRATLVAVEPVAVGTVNDRLSAIGSGEAIQSVVVMPQATGTVAEILVSSGQRVTKGQVLARLDDDEQVIERDKAQVSLKSAVEKSASYKNLQSVARLDVLDAQIAEQSARLAVSTANLNLKRRNIVAPIDGIAGIVAVNVGDNVTTQTSIVTLDDRSSILVDFWAPERFATAITPGLAVEATSIARPGQVFKGAVQAIDNRIDAASRTMRIRAKVENTGDELRAGMSFAVSVRFAGESYPSVDPLAVQWDAEGSYVWQIKDNKSVKTRVRIIQRNPDAVLVDASLKQGDNVAIEGLQRVREGGAVRLAGSQNAPEVAAQ